MADGQTDVWIDGWTEVRMDLSSKVNLIYIFNILILCYVMQSVLVLTNQWSPALNYFPIHKQISCGWLQQWNIGICLRDLIDHKVAKNVQKLQ